MSKAFKLCSAPIPAPSKPPAGRLSVCFGQAISHVLLLWILALPGTEVSGSAQVTGAISGRVEDATGAAVGGTTVTVKTIERGATRSVITDESGNFRVLALPIGPQEVRAEHTGFKTAVRSGIHLAVGQEAVVNLQLEVGDVVTNTIVVAETPLVNTTTSPVSGLVGAAQ